MTEAWFLASAIALGCALLAVKAVRCALSGMFTASARSSRSVRVAPHPRRSHNDAPRP